MLLMILFTIFSASIETERFKVSYKRSIYNTKFRNNMCELVTSSVLPHSLFSDHLAVDVRPSLTCKLDGHS